MTPGVKNRNGARDRGDDKWWIQLAVKAVWAMIPVSVGMTVWVMTQLYAVEASSKKYSDENDKQILELIKDNQNQMLHSMEKIEDKIDKNQDMIVDEIKRGRRR